MLGEPIARIAEAVRKPREVEAVAQRRATARGGGDGGEVED